MSAAEESLLFLETFRFIFHAGIIAKQGPGREHTASIAQCLFVAECRQFAPAISTQKRVAFLPAAHIIALLFDGERQWLH